MGVYSVDFNTPCPANILSATKITIVEKPHFPSSSRLVVRSGECNVGPISSLRGSVVAGAGEWGRLEQHVEIEGRSEQHRLLQRSRSQTRTTGAQKVPVASTTTPRH